MSSEDSNKDSNALKRVFRPNSIIEGDLDTPEDHNLFISVTLLRTGEIIYLDRINTSTHIRMQHYRVRSGRVIFRLDPLGEDDPIDPSTVRLAINDATDRDLANIALIYRQYLFYYTGSEPIGYSFQDVNITVFIATDEEEKAWNIPPHVPLADRRHYFWDKDAAEGKDDGASDTKGKEKSEGKDGRRETRVYEPRPPFAANPGPYEMIWDGCQEKHDKKCVIS